MFACCLAMVSSSHRHSSHARHLLTSCEEFRAARFGSGPGAAPWMYLYGSDQAARIYSSPTVSVLERFGCSQSDGASRARGGVLATGAGVRHSPTFYPSWLNQINLNAESSASDASLQERCGLTLFPRDRGSRSQFRTIVVKAPSRSAAVCPPCNTRQLDGCSGRMRHSGEKALGYGCLVFCSTSSIQRGRLLLYGKSLEGIKP
ncbi:hypothetical protein VTG60DRAFT_1924 [Thermothelomyces hinnuleus]